MDVAGPVSKVSYPFKNTEFCPNYSLSFKIPPPDVFQASHFNGVTRQQGLFLSLPLDSSENPGGLPLSLGLLQDRALETQETQLGLCLAVYH